ncbi:MAG: GatB/YqeY domain-containing protein [Candidatus Neomarinimicrobiota bacterium]
MNLKEQLHKDLVSAMKAHDEVRTNVVRLLRGSIKKQEIDTMHELSPDELIGVLTNAAKQRRDSIEAYAKGNRADLVAQETAELEIIQRYLPKEMTREEIEKVVIETIAETGAQGLKDLGKVMSAVMAKVKGRANGRDVQALVRSKLS